MDNWTIIRVELENDNHCYYSLYTPQPLNPEVDIELENEDGTSFIIPSESFEIVHENMREKQMDAFMALSVVEQDAEMNKTGLASG